MTKRNIILTTLLLCVMSSFASELSDRLKLIKNVKAVSSLTTTHHAEKWTVTFSHPLDWDNKKTGTFDHRVIVMHRGFDRPTVMVTEGYGAAYALNEKYDEELAGILDANIVFVEHRYFLESTPSPCDYTHLTVKNSMGDLHDVRTALKEIYPNKWLATGISKGGSTTMYYSAFFPGDVDAYVPYVGPMNTGLQDGRHEHFLDNVGTVMERSLVRNYQIEMFQAKDKMVPLFEARCAAESLQFRRPIREIYDYCLLEFPFAFWQWGRSVDEIPSTTTDSDSTMVAYLFKAVGPDYFAVNKNVNYSFDVQAAKELGYYGYDILPFTEWLDVKSTKNYMHEVFLHDSEQGLTYDGTANIFTLNYLKNNDPKMIFIYGECDPWSATGICSWLDFSAKQNMHLFIDPHGSHKARVNTLPESMKKRATELIKQWMN